MIGNFQHREWKARTWYEVVFDDGHGNGLCFPCDENGAPHFYTDEARRNYEFALLHPEKYDRFNKVIKQTQEYRDNARGTCHCGAEIELYNEYMGACECPSCGQWYNLFGQELNNPETWSEGDDW